MWRDAALIAGKDLRLEWRARVVVNQVVPFAVAVLMLFAFALDPDRGVLERATAGLFWVTVLLAAVLAIQRSFAVEADDGIREAMLLAGLAPAGIYLGKAAAVAVQLLALEAVLGVGVVLFYGVALRGLALLAVAAVLATIGLVAAGTVYGGLAVGLRVRETILPLLFLPVVAPVLIAVTRASESALAGQSAEGWRWCALLAAIAGAYLVVGLASFETLLEDT